MDGTQQNRGVTYVGAKAFVSEPNFPCLASILREKKKRKIDGKKETNELTSQRHQPGVCGNADSQEGYDRHNAPNHCSRLIRPKPKTGETYEEKGPLFVAVKRGVGCKAEDEVPYRLCSQNCPSK